MDETVLSSAYFPPAVYMGLVATSKSIIIDHHEHFIKQTYRSRCNILGVNGKQALSIPVNWGNHMPMKEVRISFAEDWRILHWRSILSAYGKSPFFEFYCDEIASLYETKHKFLVDWNMAALEISMDLLGIDTPIAIAENYIEKGTKPYDFREIISPKREFGYPALEVSLPAYQQVFSDRHEFIENLSVLDLLFNLGPECGEYLKSLITVKDV